MFCPYCNHTHTEVNETRVAEDGTNTRRRRSCAKCHKRFTTYERVENISLMVIKRDGRRQQFDRDKLRTGLQKSCEQTKVSLEDINRIIDDIERKIRNEDTLEIESQKIGQMVATGLKKIDKIAYIRFASVFKRFVDVEDFEKEVQKLIKTNN